MIRALMQTHENPKAISAATSATGRFSIWGLASALLLWHWHYADVWQTLQPHLVMMVLALPFVLAWPARRRLVLSIATTLTIAEFFGEHYLRGLDFAAPATWGSHPTALLHFAELTGGVVLGLYALFLIACRFRSLPALAQRHPVVMLHAGIWILIGAMLRWPQLWVLSTFLPVLAWRVAYLAQLAARGNLGSSSFGDHLFCLWPVYGPSNSTPIGKGAEFLSRHEARNGEQLARSQLAGLKLLILAFAWTIARQAMDAAVYGDPSSPFRGLFGGLSLELPRLQRMMELHLTDARSAVACLYLELIRWTLEIAVYGHLVVGSLRLLGFHVFRHTYRPLLAESLVDFWGRWTYYYKEVLNDFFFFPTFLRSSWASPKVRLFLAVFAAALVGNMYFDVLWNLDLLLYGKREWMWAHWGSRTVYCTLLATGIWVSMLRQKQERSGQAIRRSGGLARAQRIAGVLTFYALAHVWNTGSTVLGPFDCFAWLLAVAGIRPMSM